MSLETSLVVVSLILLGLLVIALPATGIRRLYTAIAACSLLGAALVVAAVGFYNRYRANARGATPETSSHRDLEPTAVRSSSTPAQAADNRTRKGLALFVGTWKSVDSESRGLSTLRVRAEGDSVWIHAWEKCRPTDCDWGEVSGTPYAGEVSRNVSDRAEKVTAVFETTFSNTLLTLSAADDDELEADTQTRFTDNSGRSGYSATYTFRH